MFSFPLLFNVPKAHGYRAKFSTTDPGRSTRHTIGAMNNPNELADLTRAVEAQIPFNRLLGLQLGDLDENRTTLTFEMRDDLVGNFAHGSLHGGVISATLDVAGGMSAIAAAVGADTASMACLL